MERLAVEEPIPKSASPKMEMLVTKELSPKWERLSSRSDSLNMEIVRIRVHAAISLRCIAFAHKQVLELEDVNPNGQQKIQDNGLILLGLVGLKDQCRPSVKTVVEDYQYAGVNVKMITGDNVFTAKAIATECGILKLNEEMDDGSVVEGVTFHNYTEEERMEKVDKICVMARSSPLDKLLMVQCLKKKGHVVAVTGDGTNDAPALKEADIGLSMEIQGTEVAK
ncbi:putative calcium-transporting ATPase 13 [Forsythia ovata]|uniref:Calcium-transporting ATPase 13 n=1 Tax=Forsythia ovata TaxID=205694 RepID=A0ABD1PVR7_9LAMI